MPPFIREVPRKWQRGFIIAEKIHLTLFKKGAYNASLRKGGATKVAEGFHYYYKIPLPPLKRGLIMPPFVREVPQSGGGFYFILF